MNYRPLRGVREAGLRLHSPPFADSLRSSRSEAFRRERPIAVRLRYGHTANRLLIADC